MNENLLSVLSQQTFKWVITGVAGFIGSNILEMLLKHNQKVIGIDNFETGHKKNLDDVQNNLSNEDWQRFDFHELDINDYDLIQPIFKNTDFVLHQAALGSVPRSLKDPLRTNAVNIDGFLNVIHASKENNVRGFIYAASSSVYGDHKELPKKENIIGNPLSPYALTKYTNELYAKIYSMEFGLRSIGLRYFNVFGKRQDPNGAYAAVIPLWINSILKDKNIYINGDGSTTRDFCYIENAVQANIFSALNIQNQENQFEVFNVAFGESNSLDTLSKLIASILDENGHTYSKKPIYRDFRAGDIKDSLADISKAKNLIGYMPLYSLEAGLRECIPWYIDNRNNNA